MLKIKIHPAFIIYAIILILENKYMYLLSSIFCIFAHEYAHARVAYHEGYYLEVLNIMPYGAMLSTKETFEKKSGVKIAFAGPFANLLICIFLLALWWVFPVCYSYTQAIFNASLALSFYNLLPVFPLDGSRILLSISHNHRKTLLVLKVIGYTLSGILGIMFLISFFFHANLNLGIAGAIIYLSTINNSDKEIYNQLCNNFLFIKDKSSPIKKSTLIVHQDLKIIRLLKHLNSNTEITFEIVNDNLEVVKILTEEQLRKLINSNNLHSPIKEFLYL